MQKQEKQKQEKKRTGPAEDKAIHYNENVERYARSGRPGPAAERAKKALENKPEADELKRAEQAGKKRARSN